ncbi:ATP-binding protein, partial [Gordonibacter sp.]|uniref:ATP-binding protein n=1 Tax=Gordonibacter sp. TaxID=1968902 RepID=UPI002FC67AFF
DMIRKIIQIDEGKCNGCGLCVDACHEGAIGLVDGKARLLRDDYCDGLGDCLPACPADAIAFVEREAVAYDEAAVLAAQAAKAAEVGAAVPAAVAGCPGSRLRNLFREAAPADEVSDAPEASIESAVSTELRQWPVQIKLVSVSAPYFAGADLLIAADCTAYAYGDFHRTFMRGKVVLVGCPKLDEGDYTEKLSAIVAANDLKSVTVVRMEVPCCGGIERAAVKAVEASGKPVPCQIVTLSLDGRILDR